MSAPVTESRATRQELLARLTPAERLVALHVCDGLANKEIAHILGKSPCTVKQQLKSAFHKLGVDSRTRLMVLLRA